VTSAPEPTVGRRWLLPTVIGSVIALVAALTAAVVANHGAEAVQHGQAAESRRLESVHALGASRVLVLEIATAITYSHRLQIVGRWFSLGADRVPVDMAPGDLQLVAAHVTGDQWGNLLVAIADSQTVANQMRERGPQNDGLGRPIGPQEAMSLARDEEMMQRGIRALDKVAQAPPA
jgi:hypothetical protein